MIMGCSGIWHMMLGHSGICHMILGIIVAKDVWLKLFASFTPTWKARGLKLRLLSTSNVDFAAVKFACLPVSDLHRASTPV